MLTCNIHTQSPLEGDGVVRARLKIREKNKSDLRLHYEREFRASSEA